MPDAVLDDLPYVGPNHDHRPNTMEWEPADWEPGDPMWLMPGNYIRNLYDLLPAVPPHHYMTHYWCHDCDVLWGSLGWADDGPASKCWMCGKFTPAPGNEKEYQYRMHYMERNDA